MTTDPKTWTIKPDPTHDSLYGIAGSYEYERGEFAGVWVARELTKADAEYILSAVKSFGGKPA